ncbi:hypothetical protein PENTCL1PPCAC_19272, partial [Pristionchus entomophagus]
LSTTESQRILEGYFMLVESLRSKERAHQTLLIDFQNLIEIYDRSRKMVKDGEEMTVRVREELERTEQSMRELHQKYDEKESALRTMEAQLNNARSEFRSKFGYINALEADRDELESRLNLVKINLKDQLVHLP